MPLGILKCLLWIENVLMFRWNQNASKLKSCKKISRKMGRFVDRFSLAPTHTFMKIQRFYRVGFFYYHIFTSIHGMVLPDKYFVAGIFFLESMTSLTITRTTLNGFWLNTWPHFSMYSMCNQTISIYLLGRYLIGT